jgi:hypothetical protein
LQDFQSFDEVKAKKQSSAGEEEERPQEKYNHSVQYRHAPLDCQDKDRAHAAQFISFKNAQKFEGPFWHH